jgi:DNA modification methylase
MDPITVRGIVGGSSSPLSVEYRELADLKPYSRNTRKHSKTHIRQLAQSIKAFGWTRPILIGSDGKIIAGHGAFEAAKLLGMTHVPTIRLENLSEEQIRAYAIADNKLAENSEWDKQILAIELQDLLTLDCADFDITATGFAIPEVDLIIQEALNLPDADDQLPSQESGPAVTQPGDLWQLGKHRILCGNSLQENAFKDLMGGRKAAVVFIDPPFNLRVSDVSGNGAIQHREFPMASGEMSAEQFTSFLATILQLLASYSAPGSVHFVCMDWRHVGELLAAGKKAYDALLNICCWVKNVGGMGSFYRSRWESVFVFRNGGRRHRNNIQLGKFGRNRTNVWEYPSINTASKSGDEGNLLALHPTCKPVALVADALLDCSARGDVVLDAFLGSGTTLIAAERTGRICRGLELDPIYVDTAIRRWQRHTGDFAILVANGKRFDDIAAEVSGEDHA